MRGCTKISAGCKHCYAERFRGVPGHPFEFGFDIRLVPHKLEEPLKWRTPRMVFVNSMSDLFHQAVPDEYILNVARVMRDAHWHTFQVLTKRAARLRRMLGGVLAPFAKLPNIWWGVSVENRKHGVPRIALLQDAPAAVRFLSIEPLLPDLGRAFSDNGGLRGIDWVIVARGQASPCPAGSARAGRGARAGRAKGGA